MAQTKKPILILQQVEQEPPAMIAHIIEQAGLPMRIILVQEQIVPPTLINYAGVIIMGGHISANDLHLDFIQRQYHLLRWCIKWNKPVLGICFGAQMLAKAAGGEVMPSPTRELGWYPLHPTFLTQDDCLFGHMQPNGLHVFQWHGETFSLPQKSTLLATSPQVIHQAFKLQGNQYGIQFHTEVTEDIIHHWLQHNTSETAFLGDTGVQQLLHGIPRYLPIARKFSRRLIQAWLDKL